MQKFSFIFLLVFISCFLYTNIFAQNNKNNTKSAVVISKENNVYPLGHLVEILEDKTQKMTFEQVISEENDKNFKLSTQKHPNQGYSTSTFWFRVRVSNHTQEKWYLTFENPNIDTLNVYFASEKKEILKHYVCGDMYPFDHRPVNFFKFVFPFSQMESFDVYIKFSGYYAKRHDLSIMHESMILEDAQYTLSSIIFSVAMILGLAIYNLLLYVNLRDKAYLYYAVYLFGVCGYIMAVNGLGFQFLYPNFPQITSLVSNVCVVFALIGSSLFTHHFLKLETWLPLILQRFMWGTVAFGWFLNISVPIMSFSYPALLVLLFNLTTYYALVSTIFSIFLGFYGASKGLRTAKFFLSAWGVLLLCVLIYVFHLLGLGISANFAETILKIGVITEAFILSFGLSDKIRTTEIEKRKAQAQNLKLVEEQNNILEQKVIERTQELQQTNEELITTIEVVNIQKNEIEIANKNTTNSINYAQRIQASILPSIKHIDELLPQNFILFKPKDVVSGDFYHCQEINDKIIISAIDCTGHGVPGALMTMLANESLNEIIQSKRITEPNIILNELHKNIRKTLKQAESNNKDGMDMVLLVIDNKNNIAEFAGAKNQLLYIQNEQIVQIKGDKTPIGGEQKEQERVFTKHIIDISIPTTFYLFTDGFADQFGGKGKKKFMIANFRKLLLENSQKDMLTQRQILEQTFINWVHDGDEKQIDDVLVMGIKVGY